MKPILYVKGSSINDVRLNKFIKYFNQKNHLVYFIGWNRNSSESIEKSQYINYIFTGGGSFNSRLIFYYPIWIIKVFLFFLFKKDLLKYNIIAINFDSALPVYLASWFKKFDYVYEVYDDIALSYNFPIYIKSLLSFIDRKIAQRASHIIHVDKNRVNFLHEKTIIIENTPFDHFKGSSRFYNKVRHKFAVTGLLNDNRGLDQILAFALEHIEIEFLFVGDISNSTIINKINSSNNITWEKYRPQEELFYLMEDCCAIFSLYNPDLEINRLAASNKVYDSMMLGIPVITNTEVLNSQIIKDNELGYIVNYKYDETWTFLAHPGFILKAIELGRKARHFYLGNYVFEDIVESTIKSRNLLI
jgi:hypothetical protein